MSKQTEPTARKGTEQLRVSGLSAAEAALHKEALRSHRWQGRSSTAAALQALTLAQRLLRAQPKPQRGFSSPGGRTVLHTGKRRLHRATSHIAGRRRHQLAARISRDPRGSAAGLRSSSSPARADCCTGAEEGGRRLTFIITVW